MSITQ